MTTGGRRESGQGIREPRRDLLIAVVFILSIWAAETGQAAVSVNVPIGDWSYSAVEKLAALALIESDMQATRPYTRLEQYLSPDLVLGLDYDRQERGVEAEVEEDINRVDLDFTYQGLARMTVRLGYRFETIDNLNQVKGSDQDNHIFWTSVATSF